MTKAYNGPSTVAHGGTINHADAKALTNTTSGLIRLALKKLIAEAASTPGKGAAISPNSSVASPITSSKEPI